MPRLVINSVSELKAFHQKIKVLGASFEFIQKNAILEVTENNILEQIKKKMRLEDFSEKIIDATFIGPTVITPGKIQVHYISNYEAATGFDVSNAREEGTNHPNPTVPKKKGGVLRWIEKTGDIIFRKKSHPKGIERLLIIEKTIQENQSQVATLYGQSIADGASQSLGV